MEADAESPVCPAAFLEYGLICFEAENERSTEAVDTDSHCHTCQCVKSPRVLIQMFLLKEIKEIRRTFPFKMSNSVHYSQFCF
uniref:Uncharacterized protein n=1 Tax=Gasterosteus aculeatus TaxID=69293 RepID=G3N4P0_GASAC